MTLLSQNNLRSKASGDASEFCTSHEMDSVDIQQDHGEKTRKKHYVSRNLAALAAIGVQNINAAVAKKEQKNKKIRNLMEKRKKPH